MKGIFYDRHRPYDGRDDWHQPVEGETIVLNRIAFSKLFPEVEIQGELTWSCDNRSDEECEGCNDCGLKIIFCQEGFTASYVSEAKTHNIAQFNWEWSGSGASEHWFDDEAICLKSTSEYQSNTGLTSDSGRIVAFKRHVEVSSFRGDCKDETRILPKSGKIWAEFVNRPAEYRANWTGFAIGSVENGKGRYTASGGWISSTTPIVGDNLDDVIEAMLTDKAGKATVCKHNNNVQAHIFAEPARISFLLCKSCRMRGVRWEEFAGRNREDICPYFRRACKSVVEKSDSFSDWFQWSGDNLLSAQCRLQDGEYKAYEVNFVRRKDGFIRRSVLLLNDRTREAWLHRYNGFIPRTMQEFRTKYAEGYQINGYMGTGPADGCYDANDRFLSEAKIAAAIAQGLEQPLWQNGRSSLISFYLGRENIMDYAIQKGEINGFQITQLDQEGQECEMEAKENPSPFYADEGGQYHLIYGEWPDHTVLRHHDGEELYRSERYGSRWFLFRTTK